jgi:hypothetical protein
MHLVMTSLTLWSYYLPHLFWLYWLTLDTKAGNSCGVTVFGSSQSPSSHKSWCSTKSDSSKTLPLTMLPPLVSTDFSTFSTGIILQLIYYIVYRFYRFYVDDFFCWTQVLSGILQTGLYVDFIYYYFKSIGEGKQIIELPMWNYILERHGFNENI